MYKANVNCSVLKSYLSFLMRQNLVEERAVERKRTVYAITERGRTVLRYFRELENALPVIREARSRSLY